MADPVYSIDVFEYDKNDHKLVIAVRRLHPYTDNAGVFHPGTQKGINVWFTKMNYGRSGRESANISAMTSTSHALFFTDPADWVEHLDYASNLSIEGVNDKRRAIAKVYTRKGWTFVGNENHRLGAMLGVKKPGTSTMARKVCDMTRDKRRDSILRMTYYVENQLPEATVRDLLDRCVSLKRNDPIITVSDLFDAVCEEALRLD